MRWHSQTSSTERDVLLVVAVVVPGHFVEDIENLTVVWLKKYVLEQILAGFFYLDSVSY
jgi:hypothetical protein